MKKYKSELTIVLAGLLSLALLGVYLPPDNSMSDKIEFKINRGDGSAKVARLLAERGVVRSRYLFIGYTVLTGKEKDFKAGSYLLSKSMNIPQIVSIFSEGKAEPEGVLATLPEGSNSWDIVAVLGQSFKNLKVAYFQKYEGYLFPDTYWFGTDENEEEMIKKMRDNFNEKTRSLTFNVSGAKLREAVVVASILEKEVKTQEDMGLVAGIIYKRLKIGMPLQVDATVAYGVCDLMSSQDINKFCEVTQVNLIDGIKVDGQYNTYARKGLPAGPISNPGLKALNAALNPVSSDYLYYLSAKDGGQTIFSRTSAEHQRNRAKYLLKS